MRFLILFALAAALHAEDARPVCAGGNPPPDQTNCRPASDLIKPTPEQQEIAKLQQQIAEQAAELRLYQQGMFQCQAAEIHQQAVGQAKDAQAKKAK